MSATDGGILMGEDAIAYLDALEPGQPAVIMTPGGIVGVCVQSPVGAGTSFALSAVKGMLEAAQEALDAIDPPAKA